ncbi:uncharacterized protein K460DRAFT_314010 [Cucurbitaria berberidis CBS 394.84]|uniref:BTB domain-containing protein n=1 Tax=Cucurbitaria berberidis CBS 394.84 TaxID=1168544 RepID=A0A9P4GIZ2_9PLEO|nr:uncharacterized protein K460DRAFT_314010 [Cucurbitaria berberidis CBS 394.84]KAF1846512.1 hypothetical protein K460DRAFT_314010 [Cucurbitaria berberidis CBS 394.84]
MDASPDFVTLNYGTRQIATSRFYLARSPVFARFFASNPAARHMKIFGDVDEVALGHVLQYLQNDMVYPFFWTKATGFDYALYHRVHQQAEVLEIWDLTDWIQDQKYIGAIKTITEEVIEEIRPGQPARSVERQGDVELQQHIVTKVRYFHVCPRGTITHRTQRGIPILCGHKCTNRSDYDPGHFEEVPYVEVVTVTKRLVYDPNVCKRKADVDESETEVHEVAPDE